MQGESAPAYGWRVRAASLLIGAALWEVFARLVASPFLPTCSATLLALWRLVREGLILQSLATSVTNLAIGFAAAAVFGVATGLAMARSRWTEAALEPGLHALVAAPGVVYVPIVLMLFGPSRATQVACVFLQAAFVVAVTTADAFRTRSLGLTAMAAAFGASENQIFWKIRWPAALPLIASGLRVGGLLAVKGMINGEMFIALTGLGALVRTYGARFEPDGVLAVVLVVTVVAMLTTAAIDVATRRVTRWTSTGDWRTAR